MLSLFILFLLFGTLLPTMQQLQQSLHTKRERMIAYETLHEAAKEIRSLDIPSGERLVNGVSYRWELSDQLCVSYKSYDEAVKSICMD